MYMTSGAHNAFWSTLLWAPDNVYNVGRKIGFNYGWTCMIYVYKIM